MQITENKTLDLGLKILAGYLLYDNIVRPVFEFTNVVDTKEEKKAEQQKKEQETQRVWSPDSYKVDKKGYNRNLYRYSYIKELAEQIEDSFSWYNDAEEQVYSAFRSLKNKLQVSQLVEMYQSLFKLDLEQELISRLSKSEMAVIYNIVNNLPSGYTKI